MYYSNMPNLTVFLLHFDQGQSAADHERRLQVRLHRRPLQGLQAHVRHSRTVQEVRNLSLPLQPVREAGTVGGGGHTSKIENKFIQN